MAEVRDHSATPAGPVARSTKGWPRPRFWIALTVGGLAALAVMTLGYWLQEPVPNADPAKKLPEPNFSTPEISEGAPEPQAWPTETVSGRPAKEFLLPFVEAATRKLESVPTYTATLVRQERVDGKLGPEQKIELKVRHEPFAVYMRFVLPDSGKEAIFAEGFHENHVVAHGGGLTKLLLPHLKVPPRSRLAMSGNRHPITEAGLLNLSKKLVRFRQMDMEDDDAETVLDRVVDSEGREWLRSVHTHTIQTEDRPFAYVEVLYDPGTRLPRRIHSYEWAGKSGDAAKRPLAERYEYDNLSLDAELTEEDFDYRNPEYNYKRF